ncbi:MAG: hypothetical protein M1834_009156 [Cirrosporium novae-zelandiae]|nr:MAG: hypothetical protein M1834_009156 [Cirrosporium novae-zelandiae]
MAALRSSSFRVMKSLSAASKPHVRTRSLHMTGSSSHPSPFLDGVRRAPYMNQGVQDLKTECKRRKLAATGEKSELVERLSNHDQMLHSRGFNSISEQALAWRKSTTPKTSAPNRTFNTSRALKKPNDSSTIDFAFMPPLAAEFSENPFPMRMPLLPDSFTIHHPPEVPVSVTKPEIRTLSADGTHVNGVPSATYEVTDNDAIDVDPFNLTDKVRRAKENVVQTEEVGLVRELWNGFLEDVFSSKKAAGF